jgi:protein pelota
MKEGKRRFDKDGAGSIALTPTEADDMWHLYNIIAVGDLITATTFRYVTLHFSVQPPHRSILVDEM